MQHQPGFAGTLLMMDHAAVMGGAEWSFYDIARHYACSVLLFEDGPLRELLQEAGIPCAVMPAPSLFRRRGSPARVGRKPLLSVQRRSFGRQVSREVDAIDILYTNSLQSFLVGAEAGKLAGVPVVWHLREMLSAGYVDAISRRLCVRLTYQPSVHVIANSRATASDFVQQGGASDRLSVIHNGVEVRVSEGVGIRAECGWDGVPVVGMFARLARWKGHRVLLDSLTQLPNVHAIIAGAPLFESETYAAELRQRTRDLGLSDRVHFAGHRDDVHALMREVDVVVHASVAAEPFGRVIVEAMHLAKPIVASDRGGVQEILTHQETGILVPAGNAGELAKAITKLLADTALANRLGNRAAEEAGKRFTLSAMFAKLDTQFTEIAARGFGMPARNS